MSDGSARTTLATTRVARPALSGTWRRRAAPAVRRSLRTLWPPVVVAAAVIGAWAIVVPLFNIRPYLLPAPGAVLASAFDFDGQHWQAHILITTEEIMGGFALAAGAGVLLGGAIAWSEWARRALVPFLVFLNTLPKVALAPLFLFWLGFGVLPNVVIAALIAFFPVVVNTSVGLSQVDPDLIDLGRSLHAPTWRIFLLIRLPNALPYIFSAFKVAVTMAVVGAIVGEFVAAQAGLGYIITTVQTSLQTDVALAAMFWISVIGLVLYGLVDLVSRLVAPWATKVTS